MVSLTHQNIVYNSERITKIKTFVDQCSWKEISFPSHKKDWKTFEGNSKTIAINILYVPHNNEEISHAYISKHNSKRKNRVILLMITENEKWHCLAVKTLSALFNKIRLHHNEEFYCLNCLHSFRTENKLKQH